MIAITGGGTGGHLAVAKAVALALKELGEEVIFIGSQNGQDRQWFEGANYFKATYFLPSSGIVNKNGVQKIATILSLLKHTNTCREILKKNQIKKVFCVGGYSAASASIAAVLSNKPLIIHEQNAHIGRLNRLLKPFSEHFLSSYYDSQSSLRDYPLDLDFFKQKRTRQNIQTVIFLGGSQGASAINDFALKWAEILKQKNIRIIHQAGEKNVQQVKEAYKTLGVQADVFGFSSNLKEKIFQADLAVSRSGASTLWELCANGLPTVFVPYPYAADNHQYHNALFLKKQKSCFLILQNELETFDFEKILSQNLEEKSKKLQNSIKKNGALKIARLLLT